MSNPLPAGVIFDVDGTLLDSEPFIRKAAMTMFAERGLTVQPEDFRPFVGGGEDRFIGGVAEKYGFPLDLEKDKARTYEIYFGIIKGQLKPLKGVRPFLDRCRKAGKKLALATGADRIKLTANLKEIGLDSFPFDAVVAAEDVARKKPDPEVFLLAGRLMGVRPEECLVVEDAVNGVRAARAAGSRCLALTTSFTPKQLSAAGADWCAANLSEAPDEVLAWK